MPRRRPCAPPLAPTHAIHADRGGRVELGHAHRDGPSTATAAVASPSTATASARPFDSDVQVRQSSIKALTAPTSSIGAPRSVSSALRPRRQRRRREASFVGLVLGEGIGGLPRLEHGGKVEHACVDQRLVAQVLAAQHPLVRGDRDLRAGRDGIAQLAPRVVDRGHLGQRAERHVSHVGDEHLSGERSGCVERQSVLGQRRGRPQLLAALQQRHGTGRERATNSSHASWSHNRSIWRTRSSSSASLISAARDSAGRSDRWGPPLPRKRARARTSTPSRSNVPSSGTSVSGRPASTSALHVVEVRVGHRLAAELPDHRAQLELGVEAQPVVDGPDVAVGVEQAVAALAVRVVGQEVERADALELGPPSLVLDEREVVLLEVGVDEPLQRTQAERHVARSIVTGTRSHPNAAESS